jgi:histidyl-tRNA synthetase
MYEFFDKSKRHLVLRPEGTASVVRAFIENNITTPYKAYYMTPAFRYERAQKGRYRQHHQLGVEAFGIRSALIDAEVIWIAYKFLKDFEVKDFTLRINSMGDENCVPAYKLFLTDFLSEKKDLLCKDHKDVFKENPLRVLDCKTDECRSAVAFAPRISEHLCPDCKHHFETLKGALSELKIPYAEDPFLVRGFDYYTRTTFEFNSAKLGRSQDAIGGGGRYDNLVENLGGKPTPAIGFGIGIERLILAADLLSENRSLDVYLIDVMDKANAMGLLNDLRHMGLKVDYSYQDVSLKSAMRRANKLGARIALILGESERVKDMITVKDLEKNCQEQIYLKELAIKLKEIFNLD